MDKNELDLIVTGLGTKSDKMRKLRAAGYSRTEIAGLLGVRYQFVRNVLVEEDRKRRESSTGLAEPKPSWRAEEPELAASEKVRVGADGSVVIPAAILSQAGFRAGDELVPDVAGEGDIRLLSGRAALRRARELVRQFVPEEVSLVSELIKERRREVQDE